jgi:hypothetical protein
MISVMVAGATALAARGLPNQLGLIAAALAGILAGLAAERWWVPEPHPSSPQDALSKVES